MPRPGWSGRRITNTLNHLWATTPGHQCWLCGHHTTRTAASIDHVLPATDYPSLQWNPANWQLAHRTQAGTPTGCPTPGCHCIGNVGRRNRPHSAPASREW